MTRQIGARAAARVKSCRRPGFWAVSLSTRPYSSLVYSEADAERSRLQPIDAVAAAIASVRARDPLVPVTVLVPSNYAGLSLRRTLGRRGGLANVGFMVPSRAAELLAAPRLPAGSRPLTPPLRREAIRAALASSLGPFAAVAGHPATVAALDAAFRDLRTLDDADLARLAARSPRSAELVTLFGAFRGRLTGYHDEVDRFRTAAEAVREAPAGAPSLGHAIAYLPRGLNPEAEVLFEALNARDRLTPVAVAPLDLAADAGLAARTVVQVAADEDEEVRAALRRIAATLDDGLPLHRIAVLFPSAAYAARCFELFASAGIPCNGSAAGTLADSIAGRALLALLRLGSSGANRDDVLGALALPLPGIDGYTPRWNALARDARITRGFDRWRDRLQVHADSLRREAAAQPDEYESLRDRLDRDAVLCDALAAAVAHVEGLTHFDGLHDWAAFADWAAAILDGVQHRLRLDEELVPLDSVRDLVGELATLDAVGIAVSPSVFLEALEAALLARRVSVRRFEDGVFVGSLDEAYGMSFDFTVVLGLAEGVFPVPPTEDPLLAAEDNDAIPALAAARHRRWVRQRQAFESALGDAGQVVLSFPRAALAAQRANVPSPWLLEVASALHGSPVYGTDLLRWLDVAEPRLWLEVTPSFAAAVASTAPPASASEWIVAALTSRGAPLANHPLLSSQPALARAVDAIASRASTRFTPFDGFVGPHPALAITGDAPVSTTRLEAWSECGYRYFLASALRVRENEDPEDPDTIDGRDRGSMVHAILDEFFAAHAVAKPPSEAWSPGDHAALDEVMDRHVDLAARAGHLGRNVPWRVEEIRLRQALHTFLDADSSWRASGGLSFVASEFGFGRPEHRSRPGDASADPVRVQTPAGVVTFRGEIDRIDRAADGSLLIYDYKTGRGTPGIRRFAAAPFDDGARLQLPVYALAAREIHDAPAVRAAYWYLIRGDLPDRFSISFNVAREAEFRALLGAIAEGIAAGVFPARKSRLSPSEDLCRYCRYTLVCPVDRARAFERKRNDPAMAPYFVPSTAISALDEAANE